MDKESLLRQIEAVNLSKLHDWACYTEGARMMLLRLRENMLTIEEHIAGGNHKTKDKLRITAEDKVINKAILDLIMESKQNADRFLTHDYDEIRLADHERDKKGRLTKCRAYFARKVVKYEEI